MKNPAVLKALGVIIALGGIAVLAHLETGGTLPSIDVLLEPINEGKQAALDWLSGIGTDNEEFGDGGADVR